jgi:hypothetical protein
MSALRIMVISGHFSTDIGYMEVHLANAFARDGHIVRVLTTTYDPSAIQKLRPRKYQPGLRSHDNYDIERLPLWFRWKNGLDPKRHTEEHISIQS